MRFTTTVEQHGTSATGMPVPPEVLDALGAGKRPAVVVTVGAHRWRSTPGTMGGRALLPLSAANRAAAGVAAGDVVEVDLELDTAPREAPLPDDLAAAVAGDDAAQRTLVALSPSQRTEWVRWVQDAKKPETRARRAAAAAAALREGRRTR